MVLVMSLITLTFAAQKHFSTLLAEPDTAGMNLRISVTEPGTKKADVGITFCQPGEEEATDLEIRYPDFSLYVEHASKHALREAVIDYKSTEINQIGGQLSVKAPFIKGETPKVDAPLEQRVQFIIDNEINPNLASHGGFVSLVAIDDNKVVVLRFGGGCHGCGMADVTLKSGIEKSLMQQCPDITAVMDVTDHESGENPYYAQRA